MTYKQPYLLWLGICFSLTLGEVNAPSTVQAQTSWIQPSANAEEIFIQVKMEANSMIESGQTETVIKGYTQVIKVNPRFAEAYFERGKVYHSHRRDRNPSKQEIQTSILDFTRAIQLNPNYVEAYLKRGNAYYRLQEYQKALDDYNQVNRIEPDYIDSYCQRGQLHYKLGNKQKAVEDYAQVIWRSSINLLNSEDRKRFFRAELTANQDFNKLTNVENTADIDYYRSLAHSTEACRGVPLEESLPRIISDDDDLLATFTRLGSVLPTEGASSPNTTSQLSLNPLFAEIYFNKGCNKPFEPMKRLKSCSKAIQLYPKLAKAYYERGLFYANLKDSQKAINEYIQAITIAPDLYIPKASEQSFIQILKTPPQKAEDYYQRGNAFKYLADYQSAVQDYTQVILLNPNFAQAYYQRGVAYCGLNDKNAVKDFTQAIKLKPDYAEAYYELGRVCDHTTRGSREQVYKLYGLTRQQAIQHLTRAIQLKPDYVEAYYERSFAINPQYCESYTEEEVRRPEVITAVKDIVQVFRLVGSWAFVDDGRIALSRGNLSTKSFHTLENSSSDPYKSGFSRMETGDLHGAIAAFNQLIQVNSADADAFYGRGFSYYRLQNFDAAIMDLTQTLRLQPQNADALLARALAYYDLGNRQKAIADATQAMRVDPRNVRAYFLRGLIQHELGKKKQAYQDFVTASLILEHRAPCGGSAGLSSANPILYYERGRMLARRGDQQGALRNLQQAAEIFRTRGHMQRYRETRVLINQLQKRS